MHNSCHAQSSGAEEDRTVDPLSSSTLCGVGTASSTAALPDRCGTAAASQGDLFIVPIIIDALLGPGRRLCSCHRRRDAHAHGTVALRSELRCAGPGTRRSQFFRGQLLPADVWLAGSALVFRRRPLLWRLL